MPELASEAIVLRTYPLKEADLIVSFFTRDLGKLRGVANRARKPKSQFGSSLGRLSHVRIHFTARENRELVHIESCDVFNSQFDLAGNFAVGVALDVIAEIAEQLLPPHEMNERFFRLLLAVLADLRAGGATNIWKAIAYFEWWAVRLSGFLPELPLSETSQKLQDEILRKPVGEVRAEDWDRQSTAELRRRLGHLMEAHLERRLLAAPILEGME